MIEIRKSEDRGFFDHGWLTTYHTFSFADYYDPKFMGFRVLRVINEDHVRPGEGFGAHSHRDMEILTYVTAGALAHKDSLGNGSTIVPGDVQYMSAGSGVTHSEFNHSNASITHLLQIWILPAERGLPPRYDQKTFAAEAKRNRLCMVASGDGAEGSIRVCQDIRLYAAELGKGRELAKEVPDGRGAWVQLIRGELTVNGDVLSAGDGAAVGGETSLRLKAHEDAEFLLFDLP